MKYDDKGRELKDKQIKEFKNITISMVRKKGIKERKQNNQNPEKKPERTKGHMQARKLINTNMIIIIS